MSDKHRDKYTISLAPEYKEKVNRIAATRMLVEGGKWTTKAVVQNLINCELKRMEKNDE